MGWLVIRESTKECVVREKITHSHQANSERNHTHYEYVQEVSKFYVDFCFIHIYIQIKEIMAVTWPSL